MKDDLRIETANYTEPQADPQQELLHYLREVLDKKRTDLTRNQRIASVIELCMLSEMPKEDPAFQLASSLPKPDELVDWYSSHALIIKDLKGQNPKDEYSDRYDLEEVADKYSHSAWLKNGLQIERLLSLEPEVGTAILGLKLMYFEADRIWQDELNSKTEITDMPDNNQLGKPAA